MPDNEFLRQKREREFQARLFAAIEKPKPTALDKGIKFINAPLFLWMLTALFITIAGGLLTKRVECITEAERLSESYEKLVKEISFRQRYIVRHIDNAHSIDDVRDALRTVPTLYSELVPRRLFEFISEKEKIRRRIDFGAESASMRQQENLLSTYILQLIQLGEPVDVFDDIIQGRDDKFTDLDLASLKAYASVASGSALIDSGIITFHSLIPRCSVNQLSRSFVTGQRVPILQVVNDFQPYAPQPAPKS